VLLLYQLALLSQFALFLHQLLLQIFYRQLLILYLLLHVSDGVALLIILMLQFLMLFLIGGKFTFDRLSQVVLFTNALL